mgnify:CR=1 FL=1
MTNIPIFPLGTVLFPYARLPLQIFEPRYVDLVSHCLKTDSGFGVVWLRQGSELVTKQPELDPRLAEIGTYAKIVDWHSLPNGHLGITIEGQQLFSIKASQQQANKLHRADIEWLAAQPVISLPDHVGDLTGLLHQLTQHPHVAALNINPDIRDVDTLGCVLAQLLPIDEAVKYALLSAVDPMTRLEQLMDFLDEMGA